VVLHRQNYERQPKDQYKWSQAESSDRRPLFPAPTSYFSRSENRKAGSGFAQQNYERQPKDQYKWSQADTSDRRGVEPSRRRTVDPSFRHQLPIFREAKNRKTGSGFAQQNYERQPKDQYNWSKADTSNRRTVDPSFPRQLPIFRGA